MNTIKIQKLSTQGRSHCQEARKILEQEINPNFLMWRLSLSICYLKKDRRWYKNMALWLLPGLL